MVTAITVAAIAALSTILAAVLPVHMSTRHKLKQIHEQVQNSHKTNMRDDIDQVISLAKATANTTHLVSRQLGELKRHVLVHGEDISSLREEVLSERRQRIEEDRIILAALRQATP